MNETSPPEGLESIAIITPTFNRAHMLEACVVSAATQTHPHVTVYVCDDGSTDSTAELIAGLCQRYANVRYLENRYLKGPQGARMTALDASGDQYVAFLDSDNRYHPTTVERCINRFRGTRDVDVVSFGQNCVRCGGVDHTCMQWMDEPIVPDMRGDILTPLLRMELAVDMGNGLIRRSALERAGGLDEKINAYSDFEFHIRLAQFAKYDSIEEPLMDYLIHGDQITADPVARGRALAAIMRRHRALFVQTGGRDAWRNAVYRLLGHARAAHGLRRWQIVAEALMASPSATLWALHQFLLRREPSPARQQPCTP